MDDSPLAASTISDTFTDFGLGFLLACILVLGVLRCHEKKRRKALEVRLETELAQARERYAPAQSR